MEQATILKIFLASPSDVKPEREIIFALKCLEILLIWK